MFRRPGSVRCFGSALFVDGRSTPSMVLRSGRTKRRGWRRLIAALGVVFGLQSVGAVDRLNADHAGHNPAKTARSSASAVRVVGPITLHGRHHERLSVAQGSVSSGAPQVKSRFKVSLPQDDTTLLIEGRPIEATGKSREFETPPLEPGKRYEYELTAEWQPNTYTVITRNLTVQFTAGDEVTVDLTTDDPNDRARIRYVPTPDHLVKAMIELAKITKDDVVYEPGCGDARITIAAVRAGASRGVGIDIDRDRVAESKANVRAANLEDQIEIRLGDALDIHDLSNATVVFLYMGDEFDLLIRPILWKQLKVGARVVSHRFTMGHWKPDETIDMTLDDGPEYLHLWTITNEVKERIENK